MALFASDRKPSKWEARLNGGADYIPGYDDGEEKELKYAPDNVADSEHAPVEPDDRELQQTTN